MKTIILDENKTVDAYEIQDLEELLKTIAPEIKSWSNKLEEDELGIKHRHKYADYIISFDIESSSFFIKDGETFTCEKVANRLQKIYEEECEKAVKKGYSKEVAETKAEAHMIRKSFDYKPRACMYVWQMAFGGGDTEPHVLIGRTWDEFITVLSTLKEVFGLGEYKTFKIWVHNLHFEFGWLKHMFTWSHKKYQTLLTNDVTYCATTEKIHYGDPDMPNGHGVMEFWGFQFQDSLCLAGVKLGRLNEIMHKYQDKCHKLEGDLDYTLIRHSNTPLRNTLENREWGYCVCDVITLNWYLNEELETYDGKITKIPMTKTGKVRNQARDLLFYTNLSKKSDKDDKFIQYHKYLQRMKLDYSTYQQVKRCFCGGFTHANRIHIGKVFVNVIMSVDIASSYPSQIVMCDHYPISPYEKVQVDSMEQFDKLIKTKACLFDINICDLKPRIDKKTGLNYDRVDNIISVSKAEEFWKAMGKLDKFKPVWPLKPEDHYKNNGRIRRADSIFITINELDWEAINMFYEMDYKKVRVYNFRCAERGHLPRELIMYTLKLFRDKTEFKAYDDQPNTPQGLRYKLAKEYINSLFGMCAQDNLKTEYLLDENNILCKKYDYLIEHDEMLSSLPENELDTVISEMRSEELENVLNRKTAFLLYQWAPVLTSAARLSIFRCISASGECYHYTDTDSCKFEMNENTMKFIEEYNKEVDMKMNKTFEELGLNKDSHKASYYDEKKKKTITKTLGYFELENEGKPYVRFATCGAKRYIYETHKPDKKGRTIHSTVAGLTKDCVEYLQEKYGDKMFEEFANGNIIVDAEHSGRLIATYIDESTKGKVVDYLGNEGEYDEVCSVHFRKSEFNMKICEDYAILGSIGTMPEGL